MVAASQMEDGICVLLRAMQSDYPGNRQLHNPKGNQIHQLLQLLTHLLPGSRPRKIGFGDSSLVQLIGPSLQEVGVGVTGGDPPSDALQAIRSFSGLIRRTLKVDSPTHDATGICAAPGDEFCHTHTSLLPALLVFYYLASRLYPR